MEKEQWKAILSKIRKYEIRIRKAVNTHISGNFSSVFKGSGLEFDDVRVYQYGDDVRHIDWRASAKDDNTYLKVFKEEKEQTVFFVLDVSASTHLGISTRQKIEVGREIVSVLALSAVKEATQVGCLAFSDQREKYIKAEKGEKKAYEIAINLYKLEPLSRQTDIAKAITQTLQVLKRRSLVIFVSDFLDQNDYQDELSGLAKKHDLIIIHLTNPQEIVPVSLGLVPILDVETQTTRWINTSSASFRKEIQQYHQQTEDTLKDFCKSYQINYLNVSVEEDFVPKLLKLFKARNRTRKG
jgi:uncharacterized protein (DUF58 family)